MSSMSDMGCLSVVCDGEYLEWAGYDAMAEGKNDNMFSHSFLL